MGITITGPGCKVCGKPSTMAIRVSESDATPFEPRCNEHNPYMVKCPNDHYQWGGAFCSTCGEPLVRNHG